MTDHRAEALAWLDRAEHDHADRSDETLALSSAAIGILHALLAQTPEPLPQPTGRWVLSNEVIGEWEWRQVDD